MSSFFCKRHGNLWEPRVKHAALETHTLLAGSVPLLLLLPPGEVSIAKWLLAWPRDAPYAQRPPSRRTKAGHPEEFPCILFKLASVQFLSASCRIQVEQSLAPVRQSRVLIPTSSWLCNANSSRPIWGASWAPVQHSPLPLLLLPHTAIQEKSNCGDSTYLIVSVPWMIDITPLSIPITLDVCSPCSHKPIVDSHGHSVGVVHTTQHNIYLRFYSYTLWASSTHITFLYNYRPSARKEDWQLSDSDVSREVEERLCWDFTVPVALPSGVTHW